MQNVIFFHGKLKYNKKKLKTLIDICIKMKQDNSFKKNIDPVSQNIYDNSNII